MERVKRKCVSGGRKYKCPRNSDTSIATGTKRKRSVTAKSAVETLLDEEWGVSI